MQSREKGERSLCGKLGPLVYNTICQTQGAIFLFLKESSLIRHKALHMKRN